MTTTAACIRCGSPVFAEDRYCGACGAPQTPPPVGSDPDTPVIPESSGFSARLLAELRNATAGEYEIRGELGRGGMAAVYLAYDLRLNRKVALKVMLPELAYHDGMEERFKREARTAAKLDHPNVVVIYSVRDDGNLLYFVMKYIEGASLDQLIRAHAPLPIEIVQYLLVHLASALQYAHEEGVVHRDVKPANVLVDRRGTPLVTDFGIAKASESPHLTRTGSVIGTPAYMSPEQCLGNEQTHASDQYALGVVAFEMIAGRKPFIGPTVEIQWAHIKQEPPSLRTFRPDCPPALERAVMRMLAKAPADRWSSLREFQSLIAAGLPLGDGPRTMLADLVRFTIPKHTQDFAVTPASPLPQKPAAPPPHEWTSLEVTPAQANVEIGSSLGLNATVGPPPSEPTTPPAVTWSSSAEHIVSVSDSGVATAHARGSAIVTARAGRLSAITLITAHPVRVAAVQLSPERIGLEVGMTQSLTATPCDAKGTALSDRVVTWTSSDPKVASVTPAGVVTAHMLGRATITAACESVTTTADVSVDPDQIADVSLNLHTLALVERGKERLFANPVNRRGIPIAGRSVDWTSSNPSIATVGRDGVVTAKAPGQATITANLGDRAAKADVVVRPAEVARIVLTPTAPTVTVGDDFTFAAELRDRDGNVLTDRAITWYSTDRATLAIDNAGHAVGMLPGVAAVTAESGGATASVRVTVAAPVIATFVIEARSSSVRAGKRTSLRANASDAAGRAIALPNVTWRSSDEQVARVEADGTVVAMREGAVTITASVPEHETSLALTVTPAPPPLRVPRAALIGGGILALGAAGILLYSRTGEAPGAAPPVATPTARAESASSVARGETSPATAPVPAAQPPVAATPPAAAPPSPPSSGSPARDASQVVTALRMVPTAPVTLEVGERRKIAVRATNAAGLEVASPRVRWTVRDRSVASVTGDGVLTALGAGTTQATASVDGVSVLVDVRVARSLPARVVISRRVAKLTVGESASLGADAYDRRSAPIGSQVGWRSSGPDIASIDNTGVVRALRAGEATIIAAAGDARDSLRISVQSAPTVAVNPQPPRPDPSPPAGRPAVSPASDPRPAPTTTAPNASGAAPYAGAPRNAAAAEAAVKEEAVATARATADAIKRGQLGPVTATGPFAKFVKNNTPQMSGDPQVSVRALGDTTAEAVVTLPLRWKAAAGPQRSGSVDVLVKMALRDGAWRRVSATNLTSP